MAQVPSNLIPTTIAQLPTDPAPSEDGWLVYTRGGVTYKVQASELLNVSGVPTTRQIIAGTGLTGGGPLSADITLSIAPGGVGTSQLASVGVTPGVYGDSSNTPVVTIDSTGRVTAATTTPSTVSGAVPVTRQIIAGVGLTGGGQLTADVTLNAALSNAISLPLDNTGSAGAANTQARADHQHPAVDLANDNQVDGLLGLDHGGTAKSIVPQAGGLVWSGADGLYVSSQGVAGQVAISSGAGAPTWGSALVISDQAANLVYASPSSGGMGPTGFRGIVNNDLADSGVAPGTYGSSTQSAHITVNSKGVATAVTAVTITPAFSSVTAKPTTLSGYGITDAQPLDADLSAIAALAGTNGLLKKTALNTWALDTTAYGLGSVTSINLTAGTGIGVSGGPVTTSGSITVTNTAPDRTVALTQGGTTTITGTYPNFTISSADQYVGTVTSVGSTSPITSTGGATPSIGMVNQGTTITVLHGNAAGNPSFGAVTAADAPTLVPYTVPQDLSAWTGFLFPDTVISTYDSTARTVTITSPVAGQLFYYWQGSKKTLGDGTTWTSSAHTATVGGWFLSSTDGTTFTWSTTPWEFYVLLMAYVYYGTTDKFGLRETHGTMSWQAHQEFHETTGTYLHAGGDLAGYTLASTTPAFRRPTVSVTIVKDEDLETTNPALSSSLYTNVTLTGTGTTTFAVETADIVPLLGNNPYYNLFSTPNWTQVLMSNNSYMAVWLVAVPAQSDITSQKYRYLWIQGQQNGSLASIQAVTSASVNVGTFVNIFTEFVFIGKIILRYQGGNWTIQQVEKLTGTRVSQASVSGGYLSAVTTDTTLTGAGTGAIPLGVAKTSPITVTADYTVLDTDQWIINNKTSACVLTFPAASLWPGRVVTIQNYKAFAVTSASSNIVPQTGAAAGTAILPAVIGNWATVVSNGTNWVITAAAGSISGGTF